MKLELDGLKDLLRPLRDRRSIEGALRQFAQRSGFEWSSYLSGHSPRPIRLSTYPREWRARCRDQGYDSIDPIVQQAARTSVPFVWASRQLLPQASKDVFSFLCAARSYGIRSGFTIPIDAGFGRKASLTFASMKEAIPDDLAVDPYAALRAGAFLDSFLDVLNVCDDLAPVQCPLTQVQLECLGWVAEGKANDDVAVLRGVTRRAVEFQLHHIRQRLDVVTTCQAVAVAVRCGWL